MIILRAEGNLPYPEELLHALMDSPARDRKRTCPLPGRPAP
jgi:hypothetical protein